VEEAVWTRVWSTVYNNDIPQPRGDTRAALRRSMRKVMGDKWLTSTCAGNDFSGEGRAFLAASRIPRITILKRIEGAGMRAFLNEPEVHLAHTLYHHHHHHHHLSSAAASTITIIITLVFTIVYRILSIVYHPSSLSSASS
jgi:hypothetical protein